MADDRTLTNPILSTRPAADTAAETGTAPRSPAADPPPADAGRYQLFAEIGEGGMGTVYRATDTVLGREVAVKRLKAKYAPGSAAARRFADEARIAAQLQHPGIPPVHDYGLLPDGRPFLAMKLIKGETLHQRIKDRADRGRLVAAFEKVCEAVAYAHAHNVLHRDLNPKNVMVGAFGEVQVMDWGLAKVLAPGRPGGPPADESDPDATAPETAVTPLRDSADEWTRAGTVLGTPAYMAPEQAIGAVDQLDARTDVFGLGGILAAVLTGRPPFEADTAESTRQRAARGELADCFTRLDAAGADPGLVALCRRCLAAEKADRPADARAVAAEVSALRAAADERARQAELAAAVRRRRWRWAGAAAAAVILALAAGLLGVWREKRQTGREKERAEQNFALAFAAADGGFEMVSLAEPHLMSRPEGAASRRQALAAGATAFREFLTQRPADDLLRGRAAEVFRMTANAYRLEWRLGEADPLYREAVRLVEAEPDGPSRALRLTHLLRDYAQAELGRGRVAEADALSGRAKGLADALLTAAPGDPLRQRAAALVEWDRSAILAALGRAESEAAAARAVSLLRPLVARRYGDRTHPYDPLWYGAALTLLAARHRDGGRLADAMDLHRLAIEQYDPYIGLVRRTDIPPGGPPLRFERIEVQRYDGVNPRDALHLVAQARLEYALTRARDGGGAAPMFRAAVEQWQNLLAAEPRHPVYRLRLAAALASRGEWAAGQAAGVPAVAAAAGSAVGTAAFRSARATAARADFAAAARAAEQLAADCSEMPAARATAGRAWLGLWKLDGSATARENAKRELAAATAAAPLHVGYQSWLAETSTGPVR